MLREILERQFPRASLWNRGLEGGPRGEYSEEEAHSWIPDRAFDWSLLCEGWSTEGHAEEQKMLTTQREGRNAKPPSIGQRLLIACLLQVPSWTRAGCPRVCAQNWNSHFGSLFWSAGGSPMSTSSALAGVTGTWCCLQPFTWIWGSKSRSYTCRASTLQAKLYFWVLSLWYLLAIFY